MKAMKNSPEWQADKFDKFGNPFKGKKKTEIEKITPFGSMPDFQVHARGYVNGLGRVESRYGKGSETLFINLGNVKNALDVEFAAENIQKNIIKGDKV